MGCKASKSALAEAGASQRSKNQRQRHSTTLDTEKEGPHSPVEGTSRGRRSSPRRSDRGGLGSSSTSGTTNGGKNRSDDSNNGLYNLIAQAQQLLQQQQNAATSTATNSTSVTVALDKLAQKCVRYPKWALYRNPVTLDTPLHQACRLLDDFTLSSSNNITLAASTSPTQSQQQLAVVRRGQVAAIVEALIQANPLAVQTTDKCGHIPLHYAIAPSVQKRSTAITEQDWRERAAVVTLLLMADLDTSRKYLHCNHVNFITTTTTLSIVSSPPNSATNAVLSSPTNAASEACSPLYRAIEALPDDFDIHGPTVEYLTILRDACTEDFVDVGNASDGDKPLALLYRRFTRQFDLAEKFFAGDNSRHEVVQHRHQYKTAAGNTWRIIELLLRPDNPKEKWRIVHRAVQVETPPDLLRYIVETNAEDLTVPDVSNGNLPLHYAAQSKPPAGDVKTNFPAFYTKYVVDELLYKFPEAASIPNGEGQYPFTLAVTANKQWIGGGIKSLYDAYPQALKQINLQEHPSLRRVLSDWDDVASSSNAANGTNSTVSPGSKSDLGLSSKEEKDDNATTIIRDEHHDAIMLVQQPNVDVSEVVASMWAHEEDAGVQMLGCVAISRIVKQAKKDRAEILRIALSAVAGVVNAMKAHPNEVIVQEKACQALKLMACTDGQREVSFVASGSVAAIVGAMQAHVSDPGVQEEACGAIAAILHYGGADRATIVASVSGVTAIINAIAAHPDCVGVQQYGCLSLKELTEYPDDSNLPELPRSQTEPLLQAAKKKFPMECSASVDLVLERLTSS